MKLRFTLFILTWLSLQVNSWGASPIVVESDERNFDIPFDQFNVDIEWLGSKSIPMFISISKNSLTWKIHEDGNKFPQLIVSINMNSSENVHFSYKGQSYIPEYKKNSHIFITTDVFSPELVQIIQNGEILGYIRVSPDLEYFVHRYVYIDHSCSSFNLEVENSKDLFTSISCRFYPNGDRQGILDLSYHPAESRLSDQSSPPYKLQLTGKGRAKVTLFKHSKTYDVKLKAKVPKHVPVFKTAFGYGPYYFKSRQGLLKNKEHLTAAYMLYGKYDLTESTSLRFFDALLNSGGLFNNFGGYFAYELGSTYDRRITVVPLLGFQSISFKFERDSSMLDQVIFPQGGEVVYKHAFGMKNYHLIYGMFLSTSSTVTYRNLWLRFGRKIFWELNWIHWNFEGNDVAVWGLSAGIPLISF